MRKVKNNIVGAVLLRASVIGATVTMPEKVAAQSGYVQLAGATLAIPYLVERNKDFDDHTGDSGFDY